MWSTRETGAYASQAVDGMIICMNQALHNNIKDRSGNIGGDLYLK